jgi:hypothetical protein
MSNTPFLNIPQVASNQNQKETTINTGIAILEAAMNDTLAIDMSAADHTLSVDEFTKYFCLRVTGNAVSRNLDTPVAAGGYSGKRVFVVENTGTSALIVRPGGGVTGTVSVDPGAAVLLKCDGAALTTLSSGAAPASGASFVTLADVPTSYTGQGLKSVRVKTTEDGLEFFSNPNVIRHAISGLPDAAANINIVMTVGCKLLTNLSGCQFFVGVLPTATTVFNLKKISGGVTTAIGSISFATTGVPTPTFAADVTFASGDVLQIVTPTPQDTTAADYALAFAITLT